MESHPSSQILKFQIHFFHIILDADMVYVKVVVVLKTIYNFVVDFFYLKFFRVPNMYFELLDSKI
jgi:hypothetical protein